jgi:hypothetical protein
VHSVDSRVVGRRDEHMSKAVALPRQVTLRTGSRSVFGDDVLLLLWRRRFRRATSLRMATPDSWSAPNLLRR